MGWPRPDPRPATTRRATAADAPAVAAILVEALGEKYRPALGGAAARIVEGEVRNASAASRGGYFVAEADGRIVGAAHLAVGDPTESGFMARVAAEVGRWRALWALAVLSLLGEDQRAPDEAHVEELSVAPAARRRGVGTALMAALEIEARRAGTTRLTLWVTTSNDGALALYRGLGFTRADRRRWLVGRWVFGAPGALYLEKRLG